MTWPIACRALAGIMTLLASLPGVTLRAEEQLEALEERTFREAAALAASSLVRIETVGGLDLVGQLLSSSAPTTGVVVGEDGWIITSSFNFANRPSSIIVIAPDGRRHAGEIVASDQARMLTLLKIDASGLTPLEPAPQDELEVGQWAIAMGRTYDQSTPNVSVGIISALGRIWGRAVQTDAKISPANYGGALVDIGGRGIGVLVPLSPEETGQTAGVEWYDSGIGFAIPLEDVYAVLDRLKSEQQLKPGLMGISFASRTPISGAAVIDRVRPGSPADDAGIREGDRITAFDGEPVERIPNLRHLLGRQYAGDEITLTVDRDGESLERQLTLAAELRAYERPLLGILPLRGPSAGQGAPVRHVLPDSPADDAALERGDVILTVDGIAIAGAEELAAAVGRVDPGDQIALEVQRGETSLTVEATLGKLDGSLPENLSTFEIPAPEGADGERPVTGRIVDSLGEDQNYWAYVPKGYNPDFRYGMVVWLHPPGDTMESEALRAWRSHCERRGIILLGPKTSRPSGWTPVDADFLQGLVEHFQQRYTVDPARIVVQATGPSASMAATLVFRERDIYRGLSLIDAVLPLPPPESDPDAPLHFHFLSGGETVDAEGFEQMTQQLRQLAHPVTVHEAGAGTLSEDSADRTALWIDALDRI
jgi:serine protease Do